MARKGKSEVVCLRSCWAYSIVFICNFHGQGRRSWGPGGGRPQYFAKGSCINRAPPIIKLQNVHPYQSVMKIVKCLTVLNFASWLSGKLLESLPLDVRFLGVKMYKIRFWLGLRPRPHLGSLQRSSTGGAYSVPTDPLAAFKGPYF